MGPSGGERVRVEGVRWRDGRPQVTLLTDPSRRGSRPLAWPSPVRWRVSGPRRCIGRYDRDGRHRPCPGGRAVLTGGQCADCEHADASHWLARDWVAGSASQPPGTFRAYLALFGRDTLKVGLTGAGRAADRLLEQGAAAHLFVADGRFWAIRRVEETATAQLGIAQHLTWRRKRSLWFERSDRDARAGVLRRAGAALREVLGGSDLDVLIAQDVCHHDTSYGPGLDALPTPVPVVGELRDGDVLAGTLVGVVGTMLLLRAAERTVVIEGRALTGWSLTEADPGESARFALPPALEGPAAQQESLFG